MSRRNTQHISFKSVNVKSDIWTCLYLIHRMCKLSDENKDIKVALINGNTTTSNGDTSNSDTSNSDNMCFNSKQFATRFCNTYKSISDLIHFENKKFMINYISNEFDNVFGGIFISKENPITFDESRNINESRKYIFTVIKYRKNTEPYFSITVNTIFKRSLKNADKYKAAATATARKIYNMRRF